jgi:putative ABC transport system substrate-binding protein
MIGRRRGFAKSRYTWGQTIHVVCRSAEGDYGRLSEAAAALAAQKIDAIAAFTHITAYAAHRARQSIPIVMITGGDPVATGLVSSLGRVTDTSVTSALETKRW